MLVFFIHPRTPFLLLTHRPVSFVAFTDGYVSAGVSHLLCSECLFQYDFACNIWSALDKKCALMMLEIKGMQLVIFLHYI